MEMHSHLVPKVLRAIMFIPFILFILALCLWVIITAIFYGIFGYWISNLEPVQTS